jgi:hypothetical protein
MNFISKYFIKEKKKKFIKIQKRCKHHQHNYRWKETTQLSMASDLMDNQIN